MHIAITITLFVISVVIIVKGGDWFVDAATWMAEVSGIPKLIVGATVVSLATTLPEMLVSSFAAGQGKVDMAIGNAVGSVTCNIGLIMAIALLFMPSVIKRSDYLLKSVLMLLAAGIIAGVGLSGHVGLIPCIILLVIFAFAMWDNVHQALKSMRGTTDTLPSGEGDAAVKVKPAGKEIAINVIKFVVGAAMTVGGAQLLVNTGSELALLMGVSERIISVTLVAIGTSLPELVTTITSIAKKQMSLSVGNIIGANIFDLTLIMPMASLISGKALPVASRNMMYFDLPAALILGCVALIPTLITGKFRRWQGVTLLVLYAVYVFLSCFVTV